MTDTQRKLFFMPEWRRTAAVHGWKQSLKGAALLRTRREDWGCGEPAELYRSLWSLAFGLAQATDEELNEDHLRYAATLLATNDQARGYRRPQTSCKSLNNDEANHVVALFRVLRDPDNLKFQMEWQDPGLARKRGLIDQINHLAPHAYTLVILRAEFKTDDLDDLTENQLGWLILQLKQRMRSKRRRESAAALPAGGSEDPF